MRSVDIGSVATFDEVSPDKAQAVKIAEEWGEVYSAWEDWKVEKGLDASMTRGEGYSIATANARRRMLDELADVVQATCNMIAALGVEDFTPYMEACRKRNEERGRL